MTPKPARANSSPSAADDYRAKILADATRTARRAAHSAVPEPFGDPASGVVLVADPSAFGPRAAEALRRSLVAVGLENAYTLWPDASLLETLLSAEPSVLVVLGPEAARAVDNSGHPLVKGTFSDAPEGLWFAWTKGISGLRLPALAPALADDGAKRRFWRAFLLLRALASESDAS